MIISQVHSVVEQDISAYAWHRLRLYKNPDFTTRHLMKLHRVPQRQKKNVERQSSEIRYCLTQAEEYLTSAARASMATRPVLMYYGLMSLALAETLVKKSGDHRLERLRESHPSHGLTLKVLGSIDTTTPLIEIVERLNAQIMLKGKGIPYGTFEIWRSEVRECPVTGMGHQLHDTGIRTSRVVPVLVGDDEPPPLPKKGYYSFADAIKSLPQFYSLLQQLEIDSLTVRGAISNECDQAGDGRINLVIQPANNASLGKLFEQILLSPDSVNIVNIKEPPSGLILDIPIQKGKPSVYLRVPPTIATTDSGLHFVVSDWNIGEFGSYYIALHICGNLARYYPDVWMPHVEKSTNFALIVEEICQLALTRLPILTAGEIDRRYYVAG